MGLGSSASPPSGKIAAKSRWPPTLQAPALPILCKYFTSFCALGGAVVKLQELAHIIGLGEHEVKVIAGIWNEEPCGTINVWELLTTLAVTTVALSPTTKIVFVFRAWDVNQDGKLDRSEVVFLLKALIRGLGHYCAWPSSVQPRLPVIQDYVRKLFGAQVSEDDFIKWSLKQTLFQGVWKAFSPKVTLPDILDFALVEAPKTVKAVPANMAGEHVKTAPGDARTTDASLPLWPRPRTEQVGHRSSATGPESVRSAVPVLPPIGQKIAGCHPKLSVVVWNKPTNIAAAHAASGKLSIQDARAAWDDAGSQCPLHFSKAAECFRLTKHEVCLANRLWHFFHECRDVQLNSVWSILRLLEAEIAKDDSLVAQAQHRHIFKLTNAKVNPLFFVCVRRISAGADVGFREFLHALCPCASDARLDLYEHWHAGRWTSEQAFVKMIKSWRRDCEEHWQKPVMSKKKRLKLEEEMSAMDVDRDNKLSVADLVGGAAVSAEVAEELMAKYDINQDKLLNINEFLAMMCPEHARTKSDARFQELLRAKFEFIRETWKSGQPALSQPVAPAHIGDVFGNLDEDEDGILGLDELVGHLDMTTAFGLMEVYDEDRNGNLTYEEFQTLVQPEVFA